MNNKYILRLIILILCITAIVFLSIHYDLYSFFVDRKQIVQFVKSFHPYDAFIFIFIQILQVLAAPIPGEVTGFIGGYIYGITLGTIYSTIGLTIGSYIAFFLSRTFGLPFVEKFISKESLNKYDYFIAHKGTFVSLALFIIPGFPKDILCYILGLSHMKAMAFVVVSTVGRLLGTLLLSIQGNLLRNDQDMAFFILLGACGLLFFFGYFFGQNWLKNRKKHQAPFIGAACGKGNSGNMHTHSDIASPEKHIATIDIDGKP